jgi:hypothetical protein
MEIFRWEYFQIGRKGMSVKSLAKILIFLALWNAVFGSQDVAFLEKK